MARRTEATQRGSKKGARKTVRRRPPTKAVISRKREDDARASVDCATAFAAEALRTGVLHEKRPRHPLGAREQETICVGDPDDDSMANEYVGDETPGGTASTPDQSNVDEIGRAYGLQEEDSGALRSAEEVLSRRDRHRAELDPPRGIRGDRARRG
jgi:hypothetical protein